MNASRLSTLDLKISFIVVVILTCIFTQPANAAPDKLDEMKARDYISKGNNLLNRREFQQAIDAYTECLLIDPNNQLAKENLLLAHNNWGMFYFMQRKYNEARAEWEQCLKINSLYRNAKNNLRVLQMTLARQGLQGDENTKEKDKDKDKDKDSVATGTVPSKHKSPDGEPAPSAIILLTPGFKSSGTSASQTTSSSSTSSTSSSTPPSSSTPVSTPSNTSTDSSFSSSTSSSPSSSSSSAIQTYSGSSSTQPTQPTSSYSTSLSSIEEKLGAIEVKIYGRKFDDLPVMRRLEKLETDTSGQARAGTINSRIDALRQSYGM